MQQLPTRQGSMPSELREHDGAECACLWGADLISCRETAYPGEKTACLDWAAVRRARRIARRAWRDANARGVIKGSDEFRVLTGIV